MSIEEEPVSEEGPARDEECIMQETLGMQPLIRSPASISGQQEGQPSATHGRMSTAAHEPPTEGCWTVTRRKPTPSCLLKDP